MEHAGFPFFSLFTVIYLGLASGAWAFDVRPARESDDVSEIAEQVKHWSGRCSEKEKAKNNSEASRCWWDAAKVLDHYTTGDHSLVGEVRDLRIDWLWRALQLTLEAADSPSRGSIDAQRGLAGPVACASIMLSDYKNCLTALFALTISPKTLTQSRRKGMKVSTSATINQQKIVSPKGTKTKTAARPGQGKTRKRKVSERLAVREREVALPIIAKVQKKKNFTAYPRRENRNAAYSPRWW
jgi:hypothetical protein